MRRRIGVVLDNTKGMKQVKARWHEAASSHLEGILSRSDRRLADVVESAYRKGAVFCNWSESFTLAPWQEALAEAGLTAEEYTGVRSLDAPLPWSHIEAGIADAFLRRERERALRGETTQDCRHGACNACGACDTAAAPSRIVSDGPRPHVNRLVLPTRDQETHQPGRDADGRLVCRQGGKPPQIAPHLTSKAVQFRIWHCKTEGCAFLSQLELQAVLDQALRRAGMPMAFSQGFHPLPLLSFGRALPVGVESRAEWFAITLHKAMLAKDVSAALAPSLPRGLDILRVEPVDRNRRTEQSIAETYVAVFPTAEENAAAAERLAAFAGTATYAYLHSTKHGFRSMDIRPFLESWGTTDAAVLPGHGSGPAVTFTADWRTGYLSPLSLCLEVFKEMGSDADLKARLTLVKTAQRFTFGNRP
jgi:radical SAM-linked protein